MSSNNFRKIEYPVQTQEKKISDEKGDFVIVKTDPETIPEESRCHTIQLIKYPYYIYTIPVFPDKYVPRGRVNYSKTD